MKLELKNIKYSASLSEETAAYTAILFKDDKKFAHVSNHGTGGSDDVHPIAPFTRQDVEAVNVWIAENTPPLTDTIKSDLEVWCSEQVSEYLVANDLRRLMRSKVVLVNDGKLLTTSIKGKRSLTESDIASVVKHSKGKYPNSVVLNTLSFDEALKLFKEVS